MSDFDRLVIMEEERDALRSKLAAIKDRIAKERQILAQMSSADSQHLRDGESTHSCIHCIEQLLSRIEGAC